MDEKKGRPKARPLTRIPSVFGVNGARRKLAHTKRSFKQRLGLTAFMLRASASPKGVFLRDTAYCTSGYHPFDAAEHRKSKRDETRALFERDKCGASRELRSARLL